MGQSSSSEAAPAAQQATLTTATPAAPPAARAAPRRATFSQSVAGLSRSESLAPVAEEVVLDGKTREIHDELLRRKEAEAKLHAQLREKDKESVREQVHTRVSEELLQLRKTLDELAQDLKMPVLVEKEVEDKGPKTVIETLPDDYYRPYTKLDDYVHESMYMLLKWLSTQDQYKVLRMGELLFFLKSPHVKQRKKYIFCVERLLRACGQSLFETEKEVDPAVLAEQFNLLKKRQKYFETQMILEKERRELEEREKEKSDEGKQHHGHGHGHGHGHERGEAAPGKSYMTAVASTSAVGMVSKEQLRAAATRRIPLDHQLQPYSTKYKHRDSDSDDDSDDDARGPGRQRKRPAASRAQQQQRPASAQDRRLSDVIEAGDMPPTRARGTTINGAGAGAGSSATGRLAGVASRTLAGRRGMT